jgi:hypothetical protein
MRHLPALVAALLLPATTPTLLGTAVSTGALLVSQAPAQAQQGHLVRVRPSGIMLFIQSQILLAALLGHTQHSPPAFRGRVLGASV